MAKKKEVQVETKGIPQASDEVASFLSSRGIKAEAVFLETFDTAEARRLRRKDLDPYVHMLAINEQKDKVTTFQMIYKVFPSWLMPVRERDFEKNVANGVGYRPQKNGESVMPVAPSPVKGKDAKKVKETAPKVEAPTMKVTKPKK